MINLYTETLRCLEENGKTIQDVLWIGNEKECFTDLSLFHDITDTVYDDSYGWTEVKDNLLIVGKDWWLERHEYDGSEWWEYKTLPTKPTRVCEDPVKMVWR